MHRLLVAPAVAALILATGAGALRQQSGEESLTVTAVRFWQPASGTTTIEGVCELRLSALASGVAAAVRYRFEVAVSDSAGLELQRHGWAREVSAQLARARGATVMESFGFAAAPGLYRVHLRVVPEGGTAIERSMEVRAFSARPSMSDLVLGTGASRVVSDTEAIAPGEFRRAGLAMRTAPVPRLSPTDAELSYYAEVYPWAGAATAGELRADVLGEGGRNVISAAPRAIQLDPRGGVTRGMIDLAGLPEGSYRLRLRVRLGDSTLVEEAPFRMGTLVAVAANAGAMDPDPFEGMQEGRLDSLYAPLTYILDSRTEAGVYDHLSVDGKRRFLREFWRRRDPTPGDADNQAMSDFYRLVSYANDAFRQGRGRAGTMLGWRTDRGRIYLRHGRPDEVLRRPVATPRPYEVWKYTRDRPYWYVFFDRNGMGDYTLIGTNDRREPGMPNWQASLGSEARDDVQRFLGIANTVVTEPN
jgi:GWxTD domain-containing protein